MDTHFPKFLFSLESAKFVISNNTEDSCFPEVTGSLKSF